MLVEKDEQDNRLYSRRCVVKPYFVDTLWTEK